MHKIPSYLGVGAGLVAFAAGFAGMRLLTSAGEDSTGQAAAAQPSGIIVMPGSGAESDADRFIASLSDNPEERHAQIVNKLMELHKALEGQWGREKFFAELFLKLQPILLDADLERIVRDVSEEIGPGGYYSVKPLLAEMLVKRYGGRQSWKIIESLAGDNRRGFADTIIEQWARQEGLPAFYAALEAEKRDPRHLLYHAINPLGEEHMPKVLEELLALPKGPARSRIIEQGIPLIGNSAPELLRELFETTADSEVRMRAAEGYTRHLMNDDSADAWEFLNSLDEQIRSQIQNEMANVHYGDIEKNLEIHANLPPGQAYTYMTGGVARQMVSERPDEAWDWVMNLPRGQAQERGATTVGREMAEYYPAKAMDGALRLPEGAVREKVVEAILETWAQYAPRDALEKLNTLPEDLRKKYRDPVMKQMAARDLDSALSYAGNLPGGEERTAAYGNILEYWRELDGASAAGWSVENLNPPTLEKTIGQTVRFWTMHEREKAAAFVPQLPEGPVRDEGYSGLGWATIWTQPEKGMAFARQIQDQKKRDKLVAKFFTRWKNRDRLAAEDWLHNSNFGDARKETLLNEDTW